MTKPRRLTRVQRDVIDRLRDGAWIDSGYGMTYTLCQDDESSRHVHWSTMHALIRRGLLASPFSGPPRTPNGVWRWILA